MPFHNIFSEKKSKKIKQLPIIIADIHEKNSLVIAELCSSTQIKIKIKSLKIGDYLIGNTIIVRKTTNDFISSMINKRLIQQLQQMKKYKQQLLIIEGDLNLMNNKTKINSNAIRGFILSILTNYQTQIIFTQNYEDTSNYLITLTKRQQKPKTEISFHNRIPKNKQEQKQYILEAFPNIGPIKAKQLLKKFKTIKNTINAKEQKLEKILRKKALEFKNLINS